jgi:hypothetical protein
MEGKTLIEFHIPEFLILIFWFLKIRLIRVFNSKMLRIFLNSVCQRPLELLIGK